MNLYRHKNSEKYLFLFTISFILSVFAIRVFLELTGYFKLGNGALHIAHVLWGGIAMLVAGVTVLIYQGDKVLSWGAVVLGVGFGFFIDEVGKFITEDNNYFFAPAAAIIYTLMVLAFMFSYYFLKRKRSIKVNEELIFVLEELKDLVGGSFHVNQQKEITERLEFLKQQSTDSEVKRLSESISKLIESGEFIIKNPPKFTIDSFFFRFEKTIQEFLLKRKIAEIIIPIYLLVRATTSLVSILILNYSYFIKNETIGTELSPIYFGTGQWLLVFYTLLTFIYVLILYYSFYLLRFNPKKGLKAARISQMFSILLLNVFAFYFEQFSAAIEVMADITSIYLINIIIKKRRV